MGPTEIPSQSTETIKIPTAHYEFGATFIDHPKVPGFDCNEWGFWLVLFVNCASQWRWYCAVVAVGENIDWWEAECKSQVRFIWKSHFQSQCSGMLISIMGNARIFLLFHTLCILLIHQLVVNILDKNLLWHRMTIIFIHTVFGFGLWHPLPILMLFTVFFSCFFSSHNLLSSFLLLQLTNEPHMSHGMINFDYKVNYFHISRLNHLMPSSSSCTLLHLQFFFPLNLVFCLTYIVPEFLNGSFTY